MENNKIFETPLDGSYKGPTVTHTQLGGFCSAVFLRKSQGYPILHDIFCSKGCSFYFSQMATSLCCFCTFQSTVKWILLCQLIIEFKRLKNLFIRLWLMKASYQSDHTSPTIYCLFMPKIQIFELKIKMQYLRKIPHRTCPNGVQSFKPDST